MDLQYNINFREKDGGFQVRISFKDPRTGKWKEKSKQGFKTKKLAKLGADKLLSQLKEELKKNKDLLCNEYMTVGEMKTIYLEHVYTYRTFNTYKSTRAALSNFDIDDIRINNLNILDIQKCINKLVAKNLSPTTVQRRTTVFKTMLKFANSQYGISIPNFKNLVLPEKKDGTKRRAMDKHEIKFLLRHMKMKNYNYYKVCLIAANTGMRLGEILGLTWDCIDWENSIVTVNKQWKELREGVFGFGELKTKNSYRDIPVTRSFLEGLKEIKSINKNTALDNRIINDYDNPHSLCVNINKCIRKNYDISMHDFRHSFATRLIHEGLDFKTTAKLLGHDVEQTMKTYSHVTDEMMEKAKRLITDFDLEA